MDIYQETNISKLAKAQFKKDVNAGHLDERLLKLTFDAELRQEYSLEDGSLNICGVYKSLSDYQEGAILQRAIELNLTAEEMGNLIKEKYIQEYNTVYNQKLIDKVISQCYSKWCKMFGVDPDKNFKIKAKD